VQNRLGFAPPRPLKSAGKSEILKSLQSRSLTATDLCGLLHLHHWHQAGTDCSHESGGQQPPLHVVWTMEFLGRHATKAEKHEASSKEQDLQQGGLLVAVHCLTCPKTETGAHIGQIASEVSGANGQGQATSGDAVLDALGEGNKSKHSEVLSLPAPPCSLQ